MTFSVQDPFFVKFGAVKMGETSILKHSLATQYGELWNKKGKGTDRNNYDHQKERYRRQLERHQVRPGMHNLIPPCSTNSRRDSKGYWGECQWRHTDKADPSAFVRMRHFQLQFQSGQSEQKDCP